MVEWLLDAWWENEAKVHIHGLTTNRLGRICASQMRTKFFPIDEFNGFFWNIITSNCMAWLIAVICSCFLGLFMSTLFYVASMCGIVLMYSLYARRNSCCLNLFFITWTAILLVVMMVIALHSKVCIIIMNLLSHWYVFFPHIHKVVLFNYGQVMFVPEFPGRHDFSFYLDVNFMFLPIPVNLTVIYSLWCVIIWILIRTGE